METTIRMLLCNRFQVFLTVLLFYCHMVTANIVDKNDTKEVLEQTYELSDMTTLLPGWTYYSIDRGKYSVPGIVLSENNILISVQKLDCKTNFKLNIDTLKILESESYLKTKYLLKIHPNCNTGSASEIRTAVMGNELYTPLSWTSKTIDVSQMFPKKYMLTKIHCNSLKNLISLTSDGQIQLDKHLIKYKSLPGNNLKCIITAKNNRRKLKLEITIRFTDITQVLSRNRRSSSIIFDKEVFYAKVKENANVGYTIQNLPAKGGSGSYVYSKNSDIKSDRLFLIDPNTGDLKVREELDREKGASQYTIDVSATDKSNNNLVGRTTVVITILDVNDNAPIFSKAVYKKTVPEEQQPKFVLTVLATDADEKSNKEIEYSIVKESEGACCPFKIDKTTGVISNSEVLDRETKSYYVFTVKAQDLGTDPGPLSDTALVNITLSDINDNGPVFEKSKYEISIPEDTAVNTIVLTVKASDKDFGSNSLIQYQPLGSSVFEINVLTGEIKLNEKVDYDRFQQFFQFTVVAFDRGLPPKHASVSVSVKITDVNDNTPTFSRRLFKTNRPILEDTKVGTLILKLSARDRDSGLNGEVSFTFATLPNNLPFSLSKDGGEIKLKRALDYEILKEYRFKVKVVDGGDPPKSDEATVLVEVDNVNDNAPRFKSSNYKIDISEDTRKGSPIYTVNAEDPDQMSSLDFEYSIVEGDPIGCFSIDQYSGIIRLANCNLDYKKQNMYKLKLKVIDEDGKSGFAFFEISIFDANNNRPRFEKSVNLLTVKEDAAIGDSVGFVTATDDDDGENARITYSFELSNDVFALNSSTGEIKTKMKLDRETKLSYQFSIKAQDHGKPIPKYSTATVVITVLDVNDNAPKFKQSSYEFSIKESVYVGYIAGAVSASDEDDGMNKEIGYSLTADGDGSFWIDPDSALIKTKKLLDREKIPTYTLVVVATDKGFDKKLSTSINVVIKLEDVQDSPPVFEKKLYKFSLDENTNVQVGRVRATLADENYKDSLLYSISKNYMSLFIIDRRRGIIRLSEPLDYETKQNYTLEIRASVLSGLTDKTQVQIFVNDVNDHPPVLHDFYIFLNIYLNGKINPVFKVPATDADATSRLVYSILSGNELDFVSLNETTGELRLLKSIMNIATEVAIKFEVHDGRYTVNAVGRITLSEVSSEMIANSMFIVLHNTTRHMFLKTNVLKKFKSALSQAFNCDSGRIFILSIEKFELDITDKNNLPKLEVAIAVREEKSDNFLPTVQLKNLLYSNQKLFENVLGINVVYIDFYNDFWCGAEVCHNFQPCLIEVNKTSAVTEESTIKSQYVVFRGIKIKISKQDKNNFCGACPAGKGYQKGPAESSKCSEQVSLCYSKPCGDHGTCFSTDEGATCQCHKGFSGDNCEINEKIDTCPGTTLFSRTRNPCHNGGECTNKDNNVGFQCKCSAAEDFDNHLCTLSTRHFPKNSYISLPVLPQRWNITMSLKFATYMSNAVLLYNGRYNNKKDFLALEIVNGQVQLSVSLGGIDANGKDIVHTVKSFLPGGVNDGSWHVVKARYNQKLLTIAVGDGCDLNNAHMVNPEEKYQYCSSSKSVKDTMKSLDLTAPLHIGGLPNTGVKFQVHNSDFVGCIKNIYIDHKRKDLSKPLTNHLTTPKCPAMKTDCEKINPCKAGSCFDGLDGLICECPENRMGKYCEKDVSASVVVSLTKGSEIVINRVNSLQFSTTSILVKTTQMDSMLLELELNQKKAYLKISNGYPCFIFDSTVVMNLTSLYISNGKWHQLEVTYDNNYLLLSGDYRRFSAKSSTFAKITSSSFIKVGGVGEKSFVGCLKGLTYGGTAISMITTNNKNVLSGCKEKEDACPVDCKKHGKCRVVHGVTECECNSGYKGPQCIDVCIKKPCQNDGKCVNDDVSLSGFKCNCLANYTGEHCETSISSECKDGQYNKGLGCGTCTCKTSENFDPVCDKYGKSEKNSFPGKCFCKDTFYNSHNTCMSCGCLIEGSKSLTCDKHTGQCPCKDGVVGRKCDRCPGAWEELTSQCNEINTSCPRTYTEGIWWLRVPPGATQIAKCPTGAFGNATRYCHVRKSWSPPNLFGCTSVDLHNIKQSMKKIQMLSQVVARELADRLQYAIQSSRRLYGKDVEVGYEALEMLIAYEGNHTGENLVSSDDKFFVSNIVYSASALFTPSVKEFWDMIQKKYAGTAGLMKEMEKFVNILATNLAFVKRRRYRRSTVTTLMPYSYAAENIYLEIQPINVNEDVDNYVFPREQLQWSGKHSVWSTQTVEILLNKELFEDNVNVLAGQISIGMVIYKTLGQLLPAQYDNTDREKGRAYDIDVYSDVFTLTVPGVDKISEGNEITIIYKNIKSNTSDVSFTCVFWNYSLSNTISGGWSRNGCVTLVDNTTDVTCRCDHLTSFALIGIRYTEIMPRVYQPIWLTYIGVFVSVALIFIVFLVYMCLRQLKSNANSIHRNLVIMAFMSWVIFILLVNRPELGENYCRLISISLHYLITCTFSWLFVEALHMYRMILEPRDINYGQMMFYYFIGYGAPLMVVGVTAGLKPEGYGNKEFCWISIKGYNEMMWVYLAPILAIVATNIIVVFVATLASCNKQSSKKKQVKVAIIRYRLAISVIFLSLLGATVVSALVTVGYDDDLFVYLFPGLCVLEALYLLLFYVVFNRKVRREAKNAYIRWKTGDKTYGIKPSRRRQRAGAGTSKDRQNLLREKYRPMLQAFHLPTSSTTDSSDTDGKRRARIRMAGSDTTDFLTTNPESSDSSDDDSLGRSRRPTVDSDTDSSDNSSGAELEQSFTANGKLVHTPGKIEWKQATQKKLITKRTYASDGPMHSTPSESDTSGDRLKWKKAGFTPTKVNGYELSAIQSESDQATTEDGMKFATRPGPKITASKGSSTSESEDKSKDKTPVSILKKKSSYDGRGKMRAVKVNKKDGSKKPLMSLNDTAEFNDSQV